MAQSFGVAFNATNTASATVPMGSLFATAVVAPRIYEINAGSDATADNAVKYSVMRASARGTSSTSIVPQNLDQNGGAVNSTFDTAWNIPPTITAVSQLLQWGQHQRGTYRWVAYDYTKMLQMSAGTGKGLVLMSVVVTSAFNGVFSIAFEE